MFSIPLPLDEEEKVTVEIQVEPKRELKRSWVIDDDEEPETKKEENFKIEQKQEEPLPDIDFASIALKYWAKPEN